MVHYNARLVKIESSLGVVDGLDKSARRRVTWEGNTDAYVMTTRTRQYNGDTSQTISETVVYIPDHFADKWVVPGCRLTIKQGQNETAYTARDIVSSMRLDAIGATKIGIERA